jgi:hypothetical protein
MDTNDTEKITIALANEFLNSFNINGLLEAAKQYSIQLAKEKISGLSEEEKEGLLKDVNERENAASNAASNAAASNEVTTENPEKELEPA